jgi:hypothetical protein
MVTVVEKVVEKPNPAKPGDKRAVQDPPKAWPPPPVKPTEKK